MPFDPLDLLKDEPKPKPKDEPKAKPKPKPAAEPRTCPSCGYPADPKDDACTNCKTSLG